MVVECHGLLTGVMRGVIRLETLGQIGLVFGTGKFVRRVVFFAHGGIGFALQLVQHLEEIAKLELRSRFHGS